MCVCVHRESLLEDHVNRRPVELSADEAELRGLESRGGMLGGGMPSVRMNTTMKSGVKSAALSRATTQVCDTHTCTRTQTHTHTHTRIPKMDAGHGWEED